MNIGAAIFVKPLQPAVNFHRLKYQGLKHIEELAGELWTNFNDSDPGVTILDQLCYALTELGYCNDFAIEDILADQHGNIDYQGQFFTPAQSLTTSPITIVDYRKCLIDQVAQINNVSLIAEIENKRYQVWLYPGQKRLAELQKLHDFTADIISPGKMQDVIFYGNIGCICDELIALIDCLSAPCSATEINDRLARLDHYFVKDQAQGNWLNSTLMTKLKSPRATAVKCKVLLEQANRCLNQHRNMAEVFYFPAILIPQPIVLIGLIFLKSNVLIDQVEQKLAMMIEAYACGEVGQEGYQTLINSGLGCNDIFNGPNLEHGWISDAKLGNKRATIHLLEIIKLIVDSSDVLSTEQLELLISVKGKLEKQPVIAIAENQVALFTIKCQFIQAHPTTSSVSLPPNGINIQQLQQQQKNQPFSAKLDLTPPLPQGKSRHIEAYYSVQNTFPPLYGIGEASLSEQVGAQRLAQAKQLKGYLMVFDQLLANQFSQLAHTADLFSFKGMSTLAEQPKQFKGIPTQLLPPTYYCQPLYHVPNVKSLLKGNNSYNYGFEDAEEADVQAEVWQKFIEDPFNPYMIGLRSCMEDDIEISERRNKMLDHLLARHGYSGALFDQLITRARWYGDHSKTKMIVKMLVLQNWQGLSYYRNKTFNLDQAQQLTHPQYNWKIGLLKQQHFQPWLADFLTPYYDRHFSNIASFKRTFLTQLKMHIKKAGKPTSSHHIKQQLRLFVEVLGDDTQKLIGTLKAQPSVFNNGQVDLAKLAQLEALSEQDFCNYSTFELFSNLVLGFVDHYRLLIDTLVVLLSDAGFLLWLASKRNGTRFNCSNAVHSSSVLATEFGDVIYIAEQAVMTINAEYDKPVCYQVYCEHLQQLLWISEQRKGQLLLELPLLSAFATEPETVQLKTVLHNCHWPTQGDCCLSIFPSYIHFFEPIEDHPKANSFDTIWLKLLEYYWPSHIVNHKQVASFGQLQQLIPCFVDWHNQLNSKQLSIDNSSSSRQGDNHAYR